ncbi:Fibrinogen- domains (FReDs) [Branchiostoma belcheri]|nr:Fibrinogen- domains (FReDs) [Branchiostoma belcheri]
MSSKKLFPNGEATPEGSVGRHGNQRTLGISMALSGLAVPWNPNSLSGPQKPFARWRKLPLRGSLARGEFGWPDKRANSPRAQFSRSATKRSTWRLREITSMREQQTAFIEEIRDQQKAFMIDQQITFQTDLQGLKEQTLQMHLKQENKAKDKGPASSTKDWRRDNSATFWKSAEVHHRSKRNSEAGTVLILGKRSASLT